MSDDMFPLNPGPGGATPELIWSGIVLLNERQSTSAKELTDFREESRNWHEDVNQRLDKVERRQDDLDAWKTAREKSTADRALNITHLRLESLLLLFSILVIGVAYGIVVPWLQQLHVG